MNGPVLLFTAMFALLLAALLVGSARANHALIGGAALIALLFGWQELGAIALVGPLLVALVAAVQLGARTMADRRAQLSPEEEAMLAGPLAGLPRSRARHFLDQGYWIAGRPGDEMTREGEQVGQLYYLASGHAEVRSGGRVVGECRAGQLVGEATVLTADPATATVTLTEPARFWCISGATLASYIAANPDVRHTLDHSFALSLREKLALMNRAGG